MNPPGEPQPLDKGSAPRKVLGAVGPAALGAFGAGLGGAAAVVIVKSWSVAFAVGVGLLEAGVLYGMCRGKDWRSRALSFRMIWPVLLVVVGFIVFDGAGIAVLRRAEHDNRNAASRKIKATHGTTMTEAASQHPPPVPSPPPAPLRTPQVREWRPYCGVDAPYPGDDVGGTPGRALWTLYLAEPDGVGATGGGCTGPTHHLKTSDGGFWWVIGTSPLTGAILSVAVYSKRFGAAIFLAPATAPIRRLIDTVGELGGSSRIEVLNGDAYAVNTALGTYVFMRDQKVSSSRLDRAERYVVLPPSVAEIWFADSTADGHWLWASEVYDRHTGRAAFILRDSSLSNEAIDVVEYDQPSRAAFRRRNGQWEVSRPDGEQLSGTALHTLAVAAR